MRNKKEILARLKSYKNTIENYQSMDSSMTSERMIAKYELRFETLAWALGYETPDELSDLYNSL